MKRIYKTVDGLLSEVSTMEKGTWIHLQNPTQEELDGMNARFNLNPTYLTAALDVEESARIEQDDGQTLIVVDTPFVEADGSSYVYSTVPVGIVLVEDVIITITTQETSVITAFMEERLRGFSTDKRQRFILQLLYRNASLFLSYLKQVDKASERVQKQLEKSLRNRELLQMMQLQKSLVFFSTSLKGNDVVLEKMMRMPLMTSAPDASELLEDVMIENRQAMEMCTIYRDILAGIMDAYASVISNNLNIVMKVLTSLTVVMSIPTIFSSLWGMNVKVPFGDNPYGFYIVLGFSILVAIVAFIFLWRKKMF
ncbi:MAG TPA: magnesium transporter CorA family protein [Clostridiales bacterium]|nr:magnesium transporter CorA family protein [Clostridiales bacterium]